VETLVLLSGGLDSAVLLAHEAQRGRAHPVYVSVGLAWEAAERSMIERLLSAVVFDGRLTPLASVAFTMRDVYSASHWAMTGTPPAYDTPDEDVYLAGRNLVLLTKAGVVAASRKLARIALGTLADNPFPDATPQFFTTISRALSLGLNHPMEVVTPFSAMHKEDVIRIGVTLGVPLEYTLSCMSPVVNGNLPAHCGLCSKCRERRDAFALAGVDDPAPYASRSPR
jgi:7-cyano-7-deazaguanine synthase